jgi:hypothetical protein
VNEFKKGDRVWVYYPGATFVGVEFQDTVGKGKILGEAPNGQWIVKEQGRWFLDAPVIRVVASERITIR